MRIVSVLALSSLLAVAGGADALWEKGLDLLEAFDFRGAAATFEEILQHDPGSVPARTNLALALFLAGKLRESRVACDIALGQSPDDRPAIFLAAVIAHVENRDQDAFKGFQRLLKLDPEDSVSFYYLGLLEARRKDYPQAEIYLRKSLELKNDDPAVLYNLGQVLLRSGRSAEGRHYLDQFRAAKEAEKPPMMGAMADPPRLAGTYARPRPPQD